MLLVTIIILIVLLLALIILFAFPKFSPIPYFPSNKRDLKLILKELNLRNNQTLVDLGAGDGIVIFEAAKESLTKNLNTKFVAVELNPVLVLILKLRRFFHPNKKNISIVRDDVFAMSYKQFKNPTFYLYISPWFMEKVFKKIVSEVKKFELVAYFYSVPEIKAQRNIRGINNIYVYKR